jgi:hypothetical protein
LVNLCYYVGACLLTLTGVTNTSSPNAESESLFESCGSGVSVMELSDKSDEVSYN